MTEVLSDPIGGVNIRVNMLCYTGVNDSEIIRTIGRNVKTARLKANLTQDGLAELADCHWKTIGKIETGAMHPTIVLFAKICLHLDTDIDSLLVGVELETSATYSSRIRKAKARQRKPPQKLMRSLGL